MVEGFHPATRLPMKNHLPSTIHERALPCPTEALARLSNRLSKRIYPIGAGLALALLVIAAGALLMLRQRGAGGYDVKGRVAGFSDDPRRLIVEHEAIEGYMPAMTMPLVAKDSTALDGLAVGDAIGFRLHTEADSSWITGVERLPDTAVARHPAGPVRAGAANGPQTGAPQPIRVGVEVPGFTLSQNQNGKPVRLADYRGDVLVLTFIYTRCPLPDYCPLMSKNFARLQGMIPPRLDDGQAPDVELLSISFDPKNDTPQVLSDYAQRYTDDLSNWTFATGTPQQVERVTGLFGVFTEQQDGQITHGLRTVVIGPDGRIRERWRGNDWTPKQVLGAVRRVAG